MRLTCVTKRMPHHGARAGYSAVLPKLRADRVLSVPSQGPARWLGAATRRLLLGREPGSDWWGAHSAAAELWARAGATGDRHLVHLLYGEDLLGLSSYLSSAHHPVVATFHQPLARVDALRVPERAVSRLHALIALDEGSAAEWRARFPRLAVHALSLGVDTGFWSPPEAGARARACLVVGGHLRDQDVLAGSIERLLAADVAVHLVGIGGALTERLGGRPGVCVHRGISDEVLRGLYRTSGAFLLSLRAASGSNALLQALATGCPVVATDLEGVRSYLGPGAGRLVPGGDPDAAAAAVLEVLESPTATAALSARGRARAETYGLNAVADRHWQVYRSVFAAR